MTKNKSLRRALIMSIISILVCSAMLVGATFAWFSDTVSTGENTIIAGNLKVDIQDATTKESLVNKELFDMEGVLWEPGMMFVSDPFVIANLGTVALQYNITTTMVDEVLTATGHGLSEVISYKVVEADTLEDIEDTTIARAEFWAGLEEGAMTGTLLAQDETSDELAVVLYWAPTANDNLYNVADRQLKTHFSIRIRNSNFF